MITFSIPIAVQGIACKAAQQFAGSDCFGTWEAEDVLQMMITAWNERASQRNIWETYRSISCWCHVMRDFDGPYNRKPQKIWELLEPMLAPSLNMPGCRTQYHGNAMGQPESSTVSEMISPPGTCCEENPGTEPPRWLWAALGPAQLMLESKLLSLSWLQCLKQHLQE